MNPIGSLMQRVFPFYIVEDLTNTDTIPRRDYCSFIIFILILVPHILRSNKERINSIGQTFIGITAPSSDFSNRTKIDILNEIQLTIHVIPPPH